MPTIIATLEHLHAFLHHTDYAYKLGTGFYRKHSLLGSDECARTSAGGGMISEQGLVIVM